MATYTKVVYPMACFKVEGGMYTIEELEILLKHFKAMSIRQHQALRFSQQQRQEPDGSYINEAYHEGE